MTPPAFRGNPPFQPIQAVSSLLSEVLPVILGLLELC
jgi:hypothetical protein